MARKFDLKYVICFLIKNEKVLLIQRVKLPWKSRWNGLGGKLEKGEMPLYAAQREVKEETGINISQNQIHFTGIVTWDHNSGNPEDTNNYLIPGMYAFVIPLSDKEETWNGERNTREGIIAWKETSWVCNIANNAVAGNMPYFLPPMLLLKPPKRYHSFFKNDQLIEVKSLPLPKRI